MQSWKEVERGIVAERLREIAAASGDDGLRSFIKSYCTSRTEFCRIWARYKHLVFEGDGRIRNSLERIGNPGLANRDRTAKLVPGGDAGTDGRIPSPDENPMPPGEEDRLSLGLLEAIWKHGRERAARMNRRME